MSLAIASVLGLWFVVPLVAMLDPVAGWMLMGSCALGFLVGGYAELTK